MAFHSGHIPAVPGSSRSPALPPARIRPRFHLLLALAIPAALMPASEARAQAKVTFNDHVLPLVEQHCAKCHNPDKKKGDLDLTTQSGVLKGGGTGPVVVSGNPDGSKLIKSIVHAEEPFMPPNKPPMSDKELAVFKGWIAGGLLETSGSKAVASAKPAADLTLKVTPTAKPDGPPPMPVELPVEPVVHTSRRQAVPSLAASPWAPLIAIAGQKQVLLYHAARLELLGILPFPDGQPSDLRFSRNGQLLLAAGGHGAKSGRVHLWQVTNGAPIAAVGAEYDTVLAADLSPDQSTVALGGTDRMIKVFGTSGGAPRHKIKKHTDWVTALAFSPDGQMLASADRNGGVTVWDADSAQELFTTAGHKSAVTALSWRIDGKVLASASEDGSVKLWETAEGKQAKTWNAHPSGVLAAAYSRDGRIVTGGRDGTAIVWDANGNKSKTLTMPGELVTRCAWSHDDTAIIAGDFAGNVMVWDAKSGKAIGPLDPNPLPLADRIAAARERLATLTARGQQPPEALTAAETAARQAKEALQARQTAALQATNEFKAKAEAVATLKDAATKPNPPADLNDRLVAARAARESARIETTNAAVAFEAARKQLATAEARLAEVRKLDPSAEIAQAREALDQLLAAQEVSALYSARDAVARLTRQRDEVAGALKDSETTVERLTSDLAKSGTPSGVNPTNAAAAQAIRARWKTELKEAQTEVKSQKAELEKLGTTLRQKQADLERLQRNRTRPTVKPATTTASAATAVDGKEKATAGNPR